jgi:hypothetical protein
MAICGLQFVSIRTALEIERIPCWGEQLFTELYTDACILGANDAVTKRHFDLITMNTKEL